MNAQITSDVLKHFLTSGERDVLAFRGAWGSGKTHAWKAALTKHKNDIQFKRYCYVSLFGINSIPELRMALFLKSIATEMLDKPFDFDAINTHWLSFCKKAFKLCEPFLKGIPYGSHVSIGLELFAPSTVRDTLICFDDLERNTTIKIEEVLGIITELKEEKGCKVALIFNADKLEDKENFRKYKEKVVDYEVLYAPTAKESFFIVFNDQHPHREKILQHVCRLSYTNIRILRKLRRVLEVIIDATNGLHESVLEHCIFSAVFICWCAYTVDAGAPKINEIETWGKQLLKFLGNKNSDVGIKSLNEYGFHSIEDIDHAIARIVENGYIEGSGFSEAASRLDELGRAEETGKGFSAMWRRFHDRFDDDPDDFIQNLDAATKKAIAHITLSNLDETILLMRQLKHGSCADGLITAYVDQHKTSPKKLDVKSSFNRDVQDHTLREALKKAHTAAFQLPSLKHALLCAVGGPGLDQFNDLHVESLKAASSEDYYNFFMQPDSEISLSDIINKVKSISQTSEDHQVIGQNLHTALQRIGKLNLLNQVRVKKFGICDE